MHVCVCVGGTSFLVVHTVLDSGSLLFINRCLHACACVCVWALYFGFSTPESGPFLFRCLRACGVCVCVLYVCCACRVAGLQDSGGFVAQVVEMFSV